MNCIVNLAAVASGDIGISYCQEVSTAGFYSAISLREDTGWGLKQPEDMIAVFDYGENTLKKTMKFSGDGNSGIQKRPHIRTGHDRHLKNGKIVHVKGCVIHKDEYNGYLSADRVIS